MRVDVTQALAHKQITDYRLQRHCEITFGVTFFYSVDLRLIYPNRACLFRTIFCSRHADFDQHAEKWVTTLGG